MHESFMREAIAQAIEAVRSNSGGPFGAVVVQNGRIVASGGNQVQSTNDPTAHGEIVAIRRACQALRTFNLAGCELYTSSEPCPMCLAAIYWARIERVYFASTREDAAAFGFRDEWMYQELAQPMSQRRVLMTPLLRQEARAAFETWQVSPNKFEY